MTRTLVYLVPILLALSAGCHKHPTYGRPTPRDSAPTTNEPKNLKPPQQDPAVPPRQH